MAAFVLLPDDVLVHILLACDVECIFACKRVCRRLAHLLRNDLYIQYKTELAVNGMVDCYREPLSHGKGHMNRNGYNNGQRTTTVLERLQTLREYGERFRRGDFADSSFEFSWQQYPADADRPMDGWQTFLGFGGAIAYIVLKPPQREISVCAPPAYVDPRASGSCRNHVGKMRSWNISLDAFPGAEVTAVSVDVSQDLLVVVQAAFQSSEVAIHLRSLDEPERPHREAAQGIIFTAPADQTQWQPGLITKVRQIQIHHEIIAWQTFHNAYLPVIEIWNWKTGKVLWRCLFQDNITFTLLDASHIVVTSWTATGVLTVYRFDCADNLADHETTRKQYVLKMDLSPSEMLPKIKESSIPVPPPCDVPFWTDPATRVIVVVFHTHSATIIPYSTFHSLLARRKRMDPLGWRKAIPWKDWGPRGSLSLHIPNMRYNWSFSSCYPYGSRVCVFLFADGAWDAGDVVTYDLNPWAAKYARRHRPVRNQNALHPKVDLKSTFHTDRAVLPHIVFSGPCVYPGFRQSPPALATNHNGFTAVFTKDLQMCRFLGSISYYV